MAPASPAVTLSLAGARHAGLRVTRVSGVEPLSAPYAFEVELEAARAEAIDLGGLPGTAGTLTFTLGDGEGRTVRGAVWSAALVGVAAGVPRYRLRLVPRLCWLGLRVRSRVFQDRSVPDVVAEVLGEHGVAHRAGPLGDHPPRPYCVQHQESDLAFVSRLLEDEGISYRFAHDGEEETLVLLEAASDCPEVAGDPVLPVRDPSAPVLAHEHVSRLDRVRRAVPGEVRLRDFDWERTAAPVLGTASGGGLPAIVREEYPAGLDAPGAERARAKLRLEELQLPGETLEGESTCPRLAPGARFRVSGHGDEALDRELLLVAVEHEATVREGGVSRASEESAYRNRFRAVSAGAALRPARRAPRPRAGPQTARVVGPAGEELHVDAHGRIKVQFPWDREGAGDDTASCWIRCAQVWAGPAWGGSFVPRVGQEVVVRFLDGDPDRPLVTGAVYNGAHPPPVQLPVEKTASTLRSQSTPGGPGSNELLFEDRQGAERVYLHAQKDAQVVVERDAATRLGAQDALAVGRDRAVAVGGAQALEVARDDASAVGANQVLAVAGDRRAEVAGAHQEAVALGQVITVGAASAITVGLAAEEGIGGVSAVAVGGAYERAVGAVSALVVMGSQELKVAGDSTEVTGERRAARIGGSASAHTAGQEERVAGGAVGEACLGDRQDQTDGGAELEAAGPMSWHAEKVVLQADAFALVVGGEEVLAIDSGGNVKVGAKSITVDGTTLALKGSKIDRSGAAGADQASPAVRQLAAQPGERAWIEIQLDDQDGKPVPNAWFRAEFSDGTVKEGRTGADGRAWVPGPKAGNVKVSFPGLEAKV